jgi:Mn-dependent DtxR family transcriptional regulator
MLASGELIRSMNYVDDITTTVRRILISIPGMGVEERQRLAEYLRVANASITDALQQLDKAGK